MKHWLEEMLTRAWPGWVTCGSSGTSCMPPSAVCCLDTQKAGELGSFCTTGSYCVSEGEKQSCKENFKESPTASGAAPDATGSTTPDANSGAEKVGVCAGLGMAILGGLVMVML